MSVCPTESKLEAENIYFQLFTIFENDNSIAKELAPLYGAHPFTLVRNLRTFAFKKKESTLKFIESGKQLLSKLISDYNDSPRFKVKALLLVSSDISALRIKENALFLSSLKIQALVPQLLFDFDEKQFLEYMQLDLELADFIVVEKELDVNYIESLKKSRKEIITIDDIDSIKLHALRAALKNKNKEADYE